MAQCRRVDAPAAVLAHPVHRLPLVRDFGKRISQDRQTLGGTVLAVGQLLRGMKPVRRQPARDRMIGLAHEHVEIVPWAVAGVESRASGYGDRRAAGTDRDAGTKPAIAPT